MDKKKSTTCDHSQSTAQPCAVRKNTEGRRRIDIRMVQNVLLIWLDENINEQNEDCLNTITRLHQVVNNINIYTNGDQCIQFIRTIVNNKVCIIISHYLGQHIVPRLHDISQVDSIFIFGDDKTYHESWVKQWPKIKGVFTNIKHICEALKQASQDCEQNATSINFVARGEGSNGNLNQLDPSFMYTQIFKETLLTIEFQQKHTEEFIEYCRDVFANNSEELKNVEKLEREYRKETPIWWYTYECLLYPMLNGALRLMDADLMMKMGFFIVDLHRHIEQLHSEQFSGHDNSNFIVYRGQGLSKGDFEQMKKTKGGLLSFTNFLSTSKNEKVSLSFAHRAASNPDLVGILFVINIDPSKSNTPFASIIDVSYFKSGEEEVIFSMHTVFRINDIQAMDKHDRLFRVNLILTDDDDLELRVLTDRIREESAGTGWYRLGSLLRKMGQFDKSEQVYEIMLEQTTEESDEAPIYLQIGSAKFTQGQY
ncbi:hypothetical protein I4U23_017041 [Adineta vaga]|nr:hypothetical protein I4U23_017041 [Adineta vaga]